MVDLKDNSAGSDVALAAGDEAAELSDETVLGLLAASDAESIALLETWLKANSRTFTPLVMQACEGDPGLSAEAGAAVLDALTWRAQADEEAMLETMEACLGVVSERVTRAIARSSTGAIGNEDDILVGSAVAVLTADRRSRHSETAIRCLAKGGTGGVLILARAFDAVRGGLKFYIVKRLDPSEVMELDTNVVASLADSVSKLVEELEKPKQDVATRFLDALGPLQDTVHSEIATTDPLGVGDGVFHARWGAGVVLDANEETATIDFGNAGTRTLLRSLTTLRRAV